MRHLLRPVLAVTVAALMILSTSISSDAARRRGGGYVRSFDGAWSVVIYTTYGDCGRALRYGVRIVGGRVVAEDGGYSLVGAVGRGGGIWVTVSEGGRSASGAGRLVGNHGRGRWRTSGGECYGVWVAERRGGGEGW